MRAPKTGLLLLNLGTPEGPTTDEVRPYLREFLMDPRVVSVPPVLRWILVNGVIAPFRSPKSAEAYQTVWTDDGSPLLIFGEQLKDKVAARMPHLEVELAMRYGEPSTQTGLDKLMTKGVDRIIAMPLYPQSASATTGSTIERLMKLVMERWTIPAVSFVSPFYEHPAFIDAQAAIGKKVLAELEPDHVLFSYHGLPEEHLGRADESTNETRGHCLSDGCCAELTDKNRFCYRAQCFATSRALMAKLDLDPEMCTTSFQSRLGRAEWIKPYTADTVVELAEQGKKRLAVFCPAFVADCLETIEEINEEAREDFLKHGGEAFEQVPCVNAEDQWADGVVQLIKESSGWAQNGETP